MTDNPGWASPGPSDSREPRDGDRPDPSTQDPDPPVPGPDPSVPSAPHSSVPSAPHSSVPSAPNERPADDASADTSEGRGSGQGHADRRAEPATVPGESNPPPRQASPRERSDNGSVLTTSPARHPLRREHRPPAGPTDSRRRRPDGPPPAFRRPGLRLLSRRSTRAAHAGGLRSNDPAGSSPGGSARPGRWLERRLGRRLERGSAGPQARRDPAAAARLRRDPRRRDQHGTPALAVRPPPHLGRGAVTQAVSVVTQHAYTDNGRLNRLTHEQNPSMHDIVSAYRDAYWPTLIAGSSWRSASSW